MSKLAREIMTSAPQCCTAETSLKDVANLMLQADCGEIPVIDDANRLVGVITDRDIVVRVVAEGKNPSTVVVGDCMTQPVVVVKEDTTLDQVMDVMEKNQIRRVPVVDASGCCCGIISQADIALCADEERAGELVREVSKDALGVAH